jgi:hypothetical protein
MSLNWNLDEPPGVSDGGLLTPERKLSSRTEEAGGGSLNGGSQLFCLRLKDCVQEGVKLCSYLKGKDKRTVCLARDCRMTSHMSAGDDKRFAFEPRVKSVLVIQTGPEVALTKPTAKPGLFGTGLDRYLKEKRSTDAWVTLLEQTEVHSLAAEEVDQVADTFDEKGVQRRLYTPWKKRRVERAVGPSPSESSTSFQDVTFVTPLDDLGSNENASLVLSNLTMEWPGPIRNLNTLHEMVASAKLGNREVADTLNEEVQTISGQLLLLLSKLGDRQDDFNGASAFDSLRSMKEELKDMNTEINILDSSTTMLAKHNERHTENLELLQDILRNAQNSMTGVSKAELLATKDNILLQVRGAIEPFINFVSKTSSSRADPEGLLLKRLDELERGVVGLRASKMDVGATSAAGVTHDTTVLTTASSGLAWSLPPVASTITTQASTRLGGGHDTALTQRIASLERKVTTDLEGQLGGEAINVGGSEFKSMTNAGAWIKAHAPQDGDYAFFLDAHGLMALANGKGATTQEVLKMAEYKEKLKYSSIDAALIAAGFQIAIPEFFGIKTTDKSAKALPGLSKSKDWDAKDGDRGLRYDITRKCMTVYMDRSATMHFNISPAARLVAGTMLTTEAQEFVTTLVSWISTFLTDRGNKGDDEVETIQHMLHAVRTIMEMLHASRAPGRGPFAQGEMGTKIFWGTLQALGVMRELRAANFSAHPALSHILNLHLQDNAVTKSEMIAMEKKLKTTMDDLKALKGSIDRGGWGKSKKQLAAEKAAATAASDADPD